MGNVQVAVVIPVYNEEENLRALMQRLMPTWFQPLPSKRMQM